MFLDPYYPGQPIGSITFEIPMDTPGPYQLSKYCQEIAPNCAGVIGIKVRRPGTGKKTKGNLDYVNQAAFDASHLKLEDNDRATFLELPLENVEAHEHGHFKFHHFGAPVDIRLSGCEIILAGDTGRKATEAYELTFFFVYDK